jgi:hypothetical protein
MSTTNKIVKQFYNEELIMKNEELKKVLQAKPKLYLVIENPLRDFLPTFFILHSSFNR